MRFAWLAVLAACHSTASPPPAPLPPPRPVVHAAPPPPPKLEPVALADGDTPPPAESDPAPRTDDDAQDDAMIFGTVTDRDTQEPLAGVTVVVTHDGTDAFEAAITDEHGEYRLSQIPEGDAEVIYSYEDLDATHHYVIAAHSITSLDEDLGPPAIDPASTVQGITIDEDYIRNIPVPGRTFEAVLGAAAGTQGDPTGDTYYMD